MSEFSPESPSQAAPVEPLSSTSVGVEEKKPSVPIGLIILGVVLLVGLIVGAVFAHSI